MGEVGERGGDGKGRRGEEGEGEQEINPTWLLSSLVSH